MDRHHQREIIARLNYTKKRRPDATSPLAKVWWVAVALLTIAAAAYFLDQKFGWFSGEPAPATSAPATSQGDLRSS